MSEYISTADPINVPFSDDNEEVNDEQLILDDDPTASPAERVSRNKKKSERVARLLQEGRQSKEEAAALRAEMAELKANQARLEGFVAAQRRPQQEGDPYQARLEAIRKRQAEAYDLLQAETKAGSLTQERAAHYNRVAAEIEDDKATVIAERTMARMAPAQQQSQAQQVWAHKYPEVYGNPKAFQYAQATYQRRLAMGERIETEHVDEIMQETMTALKLGGKGKPTVSEKSRMSGHSSGAGGGGGSGGPGIPMTKDLRRMATALYSDLSEDDAVKKWAQTVGKTLRKDKVL
jgi:hypothetical protein